MPRRLNHCFFSAVFAAQLASGCDQTSPVGDATSSCEGAKCDDAESGEGEYDFIIVGSGAGGGPLAANLARNGHHVLLLEAGQDSGDKLSYRVPAFHGIASEDPDLAWSYFVDHYGDEARAARDPKLVKHDNGEHRGILYPRGGTLGGSTAVNAMITVKPHDRDWNRMAELTGDPSWRAEEMQRYFDRVTRWLSVESPDPKVVALDFRLQRIIASAALAFVNGQNGGSFIKQLFADIDTLVGILAKNVNENNASVEGVYSFPLATRNGERNGPREYLLRTVAEGYPLTIKTGALATRVLFADESAEGGSGRARVIGVEFIEGEHLYAADPRADLQSPQPQAQRVLASKEVILSAGAFNTPQLLQLSGIGPRQELEQHGIEVEVDLPGVGTNLQDRYEVGIVGRVKEAFKVLKPCTFSAEGGNDPCLESWEQGKGVYEANGSVAAILKRSSREEPDPNLFIFGVPGKFTGYYPGYSADAIADKSLFTWVILEAHTQNRAGTVTLRSSDPRETPHIDFAYFDHGDRDEGQDQHDLAEMVKAINFVREMQKTTDKLLLLESYEEQVPGPEVDTAAALGQFVKNEAWGHHACCTAPMGNGDEAVVDSRFRVRGTEGLRVVDASVFPEIPGLFIVTPIYMTSEKATDVILEDWGETRVESNQP